MSTFKAVVIPVFPILPNQPAIVSYNLFSYTGGTTTPTPTWKDSGGAVQNANPMVIQVNSATPVYVEVFCQVGTNLKFELALTTDTNPPSSPLWTVDNLFIGDNLDLTPYFSISGGRVTGTNVTLTAPILNNPAINDSNAVAAITVAAATTPVNYLTVTNAATAVAPLIQTAGTDANIKLALRGKGTSGVITGTPTGTVPVIWEPGSTTNTISHSVPAITAARTVTWPDANVTIPSNIYVQEVFTMSIGGTASGATTFAANATPTTAGGSLVQSVSITPKLVGNRLRVMAEGLLSIATSAGLVGICLFQGSALLSAKIIYANVAGGSQYVLYGDVAAANLTSQTFSIYIGVVSGSGQSWYWNYIGAANTFNSTIESTIKVTEYSA